MKTCCSSIFLLFILLLSYGTKGQELNASVEVSIDKVKANATNPRIFETLKQSVQTFLNNTQWTEDEFAIEERIECSFLITIDKIVSGTSYEASIQVTSSRPVFNANYNTSLLNYKDNDFNFSYQENTPIIFTPDQFRDNLSSVLAYYAYIILAYDYDSFSLEGGKPYFTLAQRIVANGQTTGSPGWRSSEGTQNRFWLVDNALQEAFQPLRDAYYEYHRLGLDQMYSDGEAGKAAIVKSLEGLDALHRVKPLSFNMQLWFTAKSQELINVFSNSDATEKKKIFDLLSKLDPSNISKYQKIKE